jgi:hypothetical protein
MVARDDGGARGRKQVDRAGFCCGKGASIAAQHGDSARNHCV